MRASNFSAKIYLYENRQQIDCRRTSLSDQLTRFLKKAVEIEEESFRYYTLAQEKAKLASSKGFLKELAETETSALLGDMRAHTNGYRRLFRKFYLGGLTIRNWRKDEIAEENCFWNDAGVVAVYHHGSSCI
jgi:hypothetical protein